MSKDLNRVQLLGRLGAAPELRYLDSGQALATFSVATSRRWTDAAGQDQEETEWTKVAAWGKLAEISGQYLHKGSRLFLVGRLKTRSWNDTETGERRSATEVIADDLILLDGRSSMLVASADDRDNGEAVALATATAQTMQTNGLPHGEAAAGRRLAEASARVPPRPQRSVVPSTTGADAAEEGSHDQRP